MRFHNAWSDVSQRCSRFSCFSPAKREEKEKLRIANNGTESIDDREMQMSIISQPRGGDIFTREKSMDRLNNGVTIAHRGDKDIPVVERKSRFKMAARR